VTGGYCSKGCTSSADCGTGASCHYDGANACFRDCTVGTDCRPGYQCQLDPQTNSRICYPN
jgi:hypothetical protein